MSATYCQINPDLLMQSSELPFDLFVPSTGSANSGYIKFASKDQKHKEKVFDLLNSEDFDEELFILEEDLVKYYDGATVNLRKFVVNKFVPLEKKIEKISEVSKGIMKQFFDSPSSGDVLRASDQIIELMETCMAQKEFGVKGLLKILTKDYYTYTHSINVGLYCMTYGIETKMSQEDIRGLGLGGMLHDVGKSKIAREILNKDGKLTDEEFEAIKDHSISGGEILEDMGCFGKNVVSMASQHHEKYIGGGYPHGLVNDEIEHFARICKVMDVYDALTTRRSYKKPFSPVTAFTIMSKEMYGHFDPNILENLIRTMGPQN